MNKQAVDVAAQNLVSKVESSMRHFPTYREAAHAAIALITSEVGPAEYRRGVEEALAQMGAEEADKLCGKEGYQFTQF